MSRPEPPYNAAKAVRSSLIMRRITLGIEQKELGERLGVSSGAVSQMESNEGYRHTVATLTRWADALGGRIAVTVTYDRDVRIETCAVRLWNQARRDQGPVWVELDSKTQEIYRGLARAALDG